MTRQFKAIDLRDLVWGEQPEGFQILEDSIIENDRWSILHNLIFSYVDDDGINVYQTSYRVGATEMQDESPFEYDGDLIDCTLMEQVEVTQLVWREVS